MTSITACAESDGYLYRWRDTPLRHVGIVRASEYDLRDAWCFAHQRFMPRGQDTKCDASCCQPANPLGASMSLSLTRREIQLIMSSRGEELWPDEERVLRKLRRALDADEAPRLSLLQIRIIQGWYEEQIGGHYGRAAANPEERAILDKLRDELSRSG